MSPHAIALPCSSHGECTYHKHWPSDSIRTPEPGHHIIGAAKHPRNEWRTRRHSNAHGRKSLIQTLPDELIIAVRDYLEPMDQACLALTCRTLALAIGSDPWKDVSKAHKASWYKHAEMLDVLQRDFSSDSWWRCPACEAFHPRTKTVQDDDINQMSNLPAGLNHLNILGKVDDEGRLEIGRPKQPLYTVDFGLVHAVMDRHFSGVTKGSCLNSLRCTGTRVLEFSPGVAMSISYSFSPKIVLDRLLIRSEFKFQPTRERFSRNTQAKYQSVPLFLSKNDFWLCRHMQARNLVRLLQQGVTRESKCAYCPSEFSIETLREEGMQIRSWQNVGTGKSVGETRWTHLSSSFADRKDYDWGMEDIRQAYERIMCSTREEFDRQVQNSKGRGGRRGSKFKTMGYKSLPIKLADSMA